MAVALPSDFIAKTFAGDNGNLSSNTLVGVEVGGQSSVIFLYDHTSNLLNRLSAYATPALIISYTKINTRAKFYTELNKSLPVSLSNSWYWRYTCDNFRYICDNLRDKHDIITKIISKASASDRGHVATLFSSPSHTLSKHTPSRRQNNLHV